MINFIEINYLISGKLTSSETLEDIKGTSYSTCYESNRQI